MLGLDYHAAEVQMHAIRRNDIVKQLRDTVANTDTQRVPVPSLICTALRARHQSPRHRRTHGRSHMLCIDSQSESTQNDVDLTWLLT